MKQAIDILKKSIVSEQLERQSVLSVQHKQYFLDPTLMLLERLNKVVQALWDGWIQVTERLPPESHKTINYNCVVWCEFLKERNVETCSYDSDEKHFYTHPANEVTHWMPLPLPPVTK